MLTSPQQLQMDVTPFVFKEYSPLIYICRFHINIQAKNKERRPRPEIDARELLDELENTIDGQVGDRRRRPPMDSEEQGPSDDVRGRPRNGGPRQGGSGQRPESTEPAKRQNDGQRQGPPRDSEVSQTCFFYTSKINKLGTK